MAKTRSLRFDLDHDDDPGPRSATLLIDGQAVASATGPDTTTALQNLWTKLQAGGFSEADLSVVKKTFMALTGGNVH